jgi:hypothetical protein
MIYSRLLPGVTNVTDRAAYFGFYPWFIRVFEARYPSASDASFREKLRLADCLMTLVAERHAISLNEDVGRHSAACPGRLTLGPVAQHLEENSYVDLTKYSDRRDENPTRYFKNPLGGLGQYYLGPLRDEFGVLRGDTRQGVGYWLETCGPLADAYGVGLDQDLFFTALEDGKVSVSNLDALGGFCPCNLHDRNRFSAQTALINLFLRDRSGNGIARAASFGLLLDYLYRRDAAETDDAVKDILAGCYAASLPSGHWPLGEKRAATQRGWALYVRNEMLSLAWLTVFKNALDVMDGQPKPFENINHLAQWIITTSAFTYRPPLGFSGMLREDLANAPPLEELANPDHETVMWRELLRTNPPPMELAVRLLIRLVSRAKKARATPTAR